MTTPLLTTKLYIPPVRPNLVLRPRLIERLNAGLHRKLTLISAPAGFGKTTLLSEWAASCDRPVAWLSLDEGDNDPARFLAYLIAALQTVEPDIGAGVLAALQSPQPPPVEAVLTTLINDIAAIPHPVGAGLAPAQGGDRKGGDRKGRPYVLILDDYHLITAQSIHEAITFLLDHLSPNLRLVIATRADPPLSLARLRARDQLTELRQTDLRFTSQEAAAFLNQVMGLDLTDKDVAALEARTEGWIAGLQMAALSMQGQEDVAGFIRALTGTVLPEIPDQARALAELRRVLKTGGLLSVTEEFPDPDYPFAFETIRRVESAGFGLERWFGNFWRYTLNFQR